MIYHSPWLTICLIFKMLQTSRLVERRKDNSCSLTAVCNMKLIYFFFFKGHHEYESEFYCLFLRFLTGFGFLLNSIQEDSQWKWVRMEGIMCGQQIMLHQIHFVNRLHYAKKFMSRSVVQRKEITQKESNDVNVNCNCFLCDYVNGIYIHRNCSRD